MSDIPIIFSGPMIRALLDGRKSMTRRLAWGKSRPMPEGGALRQHKKVLMSIPGLKSGGDTYRPASPWQKVKPGDRLYVRERFGSCEVEGQGIGNYFIIYDEEWSRRHKDRGAGEPRPKVLRPSGMKPGLHPSIHMPRWASRLTLVVTAVKVERLQEISEADAIAEGVIPIFRDGTPIQHDGTGAVCREAFQKLWSSLHGADAWAANPEVVVLSFVVHQANIDTMKEAA